MASSGSYMALPGGGDVYRSTTTVAENRMGNNMMETVKKVFQLTGNQGKEVYSTVVSLPTEDTEENVLAKTGLLSPRNAMPTSTSMEETALLGCMPSDSMDDIELKNIQMQYPSVRSLDSNEDVSKSEEKVETSHGTMLVVIQGDRKKPAIVTYHDLGLNSSSNFQTFFNYVDMRILLYQFCVYHLNAPGQEEGAPTLPENFVYPTMEELSDQVEEVLNHFKLQHIIGFGVGAGANILSRFALKNPDMVDALCLVNCVSTQASWIEWGYQKMNARYLRNKGMTQGVLEYLMWHHFGKAWEERNHDLVQVYRQYFEQQVNPTNLALLIGSYINRSDLRIMRELDPNKRRDSCTLRMSVLNITGALSPHVDDTVTFNGRLDPSNSTWMKIQDCGMVIEEQPAKVSEAFRLFLQGIGYVPSLSLTKMNTIRRFSETGIPLSVAYPESRKGSLASLESRSVAIASAKTNINITENPLTDTAIC